MLGEKNKKSHPQLIAFGNVLLDFSFATRDSESGSDDILKRFNLKADDLGECSLEKLARIQRDAKES